METFDQSDRDTTASWIEPAAATALATVVTYSMEKPPSLYDIPTLLLLVPFFLAGCFIGFRQAGREKRGYNITMVAAGAGIAVGVVGWVFAVEALYLKSAFDGSLYAEHNLWPFEIVSWFVQAVIPILVGFLLGEVLFRRFRDVSYRNTLFVSLLAVTFVLFGLAVWSGAAETTPVGPDGKLVPAGAVSAVHFGRGAEPRANPVPGDARCLENTGDTCDEPGEPCWFSFGKTWTDTFHLYNGRCECRCFGRSDTFWSPPNTN